MNESDRTSIALDRNEIRQEALESVVRKTDDRLPIMVEICLPRMVQQYLHHVAERYLDRHLPTKTNQLLSERAPELHHISRSPIVSHVEQEYVTPDNHKAFGKGNELRVKCKSNYPTSRTVTARKCYRKQTAERRLTG